MVGARVRTADGWFVARTAGAALRGLRRGTRRGLEGVRRVPTVGWVFGFGIVGCQG